MNALKSLKIATGITLIVAAVVGLIMGMMYVMYVLQRGPMWVSIIMVFLLFWGLVFLFVWTNE